MIAHTVNKHEVKKLQFDLTEPWDDLNMRWGRIESDYEIERWFLSWNVPATKQMKTGISIHYEITFDCGSHFQTRSQFHFWSMSHLCDSNPLHLNPSTFKCWQLRYFWVSELNACWNWTLVETLVWTKKRFDNWLFFNYVIRNVIALKIFFPN